MNAGRCREAIPRFTAAIDARPPGRRRASRPRRVRDSSEADGGGTAHVNRRAGAVEPGNPVVSANLGLLLSDTGHRPTRFLILQRALTLDPDLHQARFGLAVAYARAGRRADAARTAAELLRRLPQSAPQRPEVERLLAAVR